MTPETRRIPDALLERYLADALDAAERARLDANLADSPRDRARLEELRADSAAFLIQHPPAPLVARFREERRRALWWRWMGLLIPTLAAAAGALVFLLPIENPYTSKGSVVLVLHRKTDQGSHPVSPGIPLFPHDSVRFTVKTLENGFVAVLSHDAQGTVTVYYPFEGEAAAPYDATHPELPDAIELDDVLGPEHVYALHSTRPFELRWAVDALRQGHPLEKAAPPGISVGHASFIKERPPQK